MTVRSFICFRWIAVAAAVGCVGSARAQFEATINVPPDVAPEFLQTGVQLNLHGSGVATLNVSGGAEANLLGGTVGQLNLLEQSQANVHSGSVAAIVGNDASLSISGGYVGQLVSTNGFVSMSGGQMEDRLRALGVAEVELNGGFLQDVEMFDQSSLVVSGGSRGSITAETIGAITFEGAGFQLDGQPLVGLDNLGDFESITLLGRLLTGTLSDGTPIVIGSQSQTGDLIGRHNINLRMTDTINGAAEEMMSSSFLPYGVRDGQSLTVNAGFPVANNFVAGSGAKVDVEPNGVIGNRFLAHDARIEMTDGRIGEGFMAHAGTELAATNSTIESMTAFRGSLVDVSGGEIRVVAHAGSNVLIRDANVAITVDGNASVEITNSIVDAEVLGELTLLGGTAPNEVEVSGTLTLNGATARRLRMNPGSTVNLHDGHLSGLFHGHMTEFLPGSTLNVYNGTIVGRFVRNSNWPFADYGDATINLYDGQISEGLYTVGTVNVFGGQVATDSASENLPALITSGTLNLYEGAIGDHMVVNGTANIFGGTVGAETEVRRDGNVIVTGGSVGPNLTLFADSTLSLYGGEIETGIQARNGSTVQIVGHSFMLNGEAIDGLERNGDTLSLGTRGGEVLSGFLTDDRPFEFTLNEQLSENSDWFDLGAVLRLTLAESNFCDFDFDDQCDVADIDALITANGNDRQFDLNGDRVVDANDLRIWLARAGNKNIGRAYLYGDSNLDGAVDGFDLNQVGLHWQEFVGEWSRGNFQFGSMRVDAADLNSLAATWQRNAANTHAVPEPSNSLFLFVCFLLSRGRSRWFRYKFCST